MLGLLGLFGALMASVVVDHGHEQDEEPEDAAPEGATAQAAGDTAGDADDPPADLIDWAPDAEPAVPQAEPPQTPPSEGESITGRDRDDILDGTSGDDSMAGAGHAVIARGAIEDVVAIPAGDGFAL